MRAKKIYVRKMGLSFLALYSKFHFPRGKFLWFWVGGWLGRGGPTRSPPPPWTSTSPCRTHPHLLCDSVGPTRIG